MIKVDAEDETFTIDLTKDEGKEMAVTAISMLWLYCTESEEDRAVLASLASAIKGNTPLTSMNFPSLEDIDD